MHLPISASRECAVTMASLPMEPPDEGVLFVVSGPSGVGKSTLLAAVFERIPHLGFSVSATTRSSPRKAMPRGESNLHGSETAEAPILGNFYWCF